MISIDGTDISGVTIDGTDVQEITIDGSTAWTAGPIFEDGFESGDISKWNVNDEEYIAVTNNYVRTGSYGLQMEGTGYYGSEITANTSPIDFSGGGKVTVYINLYSIGGAGSWSVRLINNNNDGFISIEGDSYNNQGVFLNGKELADYPILDGQPTQNEWWKLEIEFSSDGTITGRLTDNSGNTYSNSFTQDSKYHNSIKVGLRTKGSFDAEDNCKMAFDDVKIE